MRARAPGGLYFFGATSSRVGDEASIPALLLFGLALYGVPATAAAVYAALTLASAIGGPLLGLVLDRVRRPGAALAGCLLGYGTGLAVLTAFAAFLPLPLVLAVAVATGLFGPALSGGWSSQLAHVLPGRERAFSLDVATYNVAGLAGPALAAVTATTWAPATALTVAVVLVLLAAPAAWLLPLPDSQRRRRPPGLGRSVVAQLRDGFAPLLRVPGLRGATLGSSVSFVGIGMFVVACPLLGAERFGEAGRGALLSTALAGASLLATLVTARWPSPLTPDQMFLVSTLVQGLALLGAGLAEQPWLTVLAVLVLGFGDGPQLAAVFAVRHRDSPARNRAQVFTTAASVKVGSAAAGALLAGVLAEVSAAAVLLAAAATQLVAAVVAVLAGTPLGRGPGPPPRRG